MIETAFTPLQSAAGGLAIGLSAVLFMAFFGRIMGATGIVGGLLTTIGSADWRMRAAFVIGAVAAPAIVFAATGAWPAVEVPVSRPMIAIGGLIVGIGATIGAGCTSGHGVCGLARFSRRSAVAVVTFMAAAFATVFVIRHVIGG